MRNIWLAGLVCFSLVTGGWILAHGRAADGESAFAAVLAEKAQAALAEVGAATDESDVASGAEREPATFYRYTDDSGSVRFVTSLADVPKHLRASAKRVSQERVQRAAPPPNPAPRPRQAQPAREERRAMEPEVVVYTTSWCGWCRKTLAFLTEQGVPFENRDIEANEMWRDELEEKTGSTSIPVVEIDGELVRGYDPARMQQLLRSS